MALSAAEAEEFQRLYARALAEGIEPPREENGEAAALAASNGAVPHPDAPPSAHHYRVHRLRPENPGDWALMPEVAARVAAFCEEFEQQANISQLVKNIQQSFISSDPGLILLAFFMDDTLIGHMLCDRAILYHNPIITVHQYSMDRGAPPQIRKEAVEIIKAWGRETGPDGERPPAQFIQWLVRDRKLAAMYQRIFKAKPHLLLMRLSLED